MLLSLALILTSEVLAMKVVFRNASLNFVRATMIKSSNCDGCFGVYQLILTQNYKEIKKTSGFTKITIIRY